jgi:T5SS/PEP-CTERM-associated repeat protein/autotransporter-associated beta strand protein
MRAMTLLRLASALGRSLALLTIACSLSSVCQGGETWDGGGTDNEWSTAANWNGLRGDVSAPPNDGTADIIMAGTIKLSNILDVDWDVNSLTFNNTAGAFSVNGYSGVTLGMGAGGVSNNDSQLQTLLLPIGLNASQTWTAAAGPILLASGIRSHVFLPRTLTLSGAFDTTVAGPIINQLTLNKTGAGTLFLLGPEGNTYAGNTNVTGGTLALSRTGGTDRAIPGNLTIGDGVGIDTVRLDAAEQITSAAGKLVTVNSSGVFNLNGFNETLQNLTLNGGSITTAGGTLNVAGSLSTSGGIVTGSGSLAVAGSLSPAGGTLQLVNNLTVTSGGGTVGDAAGSSGQVTVSGANWTNSGDLHVGNAGAGTLMVSNTGGVANSGDLYVGNANSGTINIASGGNLMNSLGFIGHGAGSIGGVTINGAGSGWRNTGDVYIGHGGNGALNTFAGADVSSGRNLYIGYGGDSKGEVTIYGKTSDNDRSSLFDALYALM